MVSSKRLDGSKRVTYSGEKLQHQNLCLSWSQWLGRLASVFPVYRRRRLVWWVSGKLGVADVVGLSIVDKLDRIECILRSLHILLSWSGLEILDGERALCEGHDTVLWELGHRSGSTSSAYLAL